MSKNKSIISAIVTFILIFIAPRLSSRGIELDETSVTAMVTGFIAIGAWVWSMAVNHTFKAPKDSEDPLDDEQIEH